MVKQNSSQNFDKNTVEKLALLGLSNREALVYLSLLRQQAPAGTTTLIRATGLHGQYVYNALETLEEKGLAKAITKGVRKKFFAVSPGQFRFLAERQRLVADTLATELETLHSNNPQQLIEVHEGREAFIARQFELIYEDKNDDTIDVFGGGEESFVEICGNEIKRLDAERNKKKIKARYLGSEAQRAYFEKHMEGFGGFKFRALPKLPKTLVDTHIRSDSITFLLFGDPVAAITVKNPLIAINYKVVFETLWALGK